MSNMNIICDSCGREVLGCTWVNGMKFCAKCYQETFGDNTTFTNKTQSPTEIFVDLLNKEMYELKIADLEAKLAESESELVLARNTSINTNKMEILHLQIENEELKRQLAEKEKEVELVKNMKADEMALKVIQKNNQDKIELLEKVKHDLVEDMRLATDKLKSAIYIDTLIKEIKGE